MSSSDRSTPRRRRALLLLPALLAALAGCQVTPLYSDSPAGVAGNALIRSVAVDPAEDRVEQQVRNELVFLLTGGGAETTAPRYRLDMVVIPSVQGILRSPIDAQPTGQSLMLTAQYRLIEIATDREIAVRSRSVTTRYDEFDQEFADIRAERDAENRAARELAELIRGDIAILLRNEPALGANQGA